MAFTWIDPVKTKLLLIALTVLSKGVCSAAIGLFINDGISRHVTVSPPNY